MTNPIHLDPDALLAAVASLVADRLTNEPDGNEFDVRVNLAIKQAIDEIVRERVGAMIDRLLVERASETFAACDGAVELVRAETMRAARERVASNMPSKDEVKRESLAVVRDAVMKAMGPVVDKVAEAASRTVVSFDPTPTSFPVTEPPSAYRAPAVPQPCKGARNGCTCDTCIPF